MILGYLGGSSVISRVYISERGSQECETDVM